MCGSPFPKSFNLLKICFSLEWISSTPYLCSSPSRKCSVSTSFLLAKSVYGIFTIYTVFIDAAIFPDSTGCAIQVKLAEFTFNVTPVDTTLANASLYGFKILSPIWIAFAFKYLVTSVPIIKSTSVNPDKLFNPWIGFV